MRNELVVKPEEQFSRLDDFLAGRLGLYSRTRLRTAIGAGACLLNGEARTAGTRLAAGDVVALDMDDRLPTSMGPEPLSIEILHEDEDLAIVVKPAGMLVHPTRSVKSGTLANGLAWHWNRALLDDDARDAHHTVRFGFPHRLDRGTSGLMVVAKTPRALNRLSNALARREVSKRYVAVVEGVVAAADMELDYPIGRVEARPYWRVLPDGKPALSRLHVVERGTDRTRVHLEPVTGRTNQLRAHCAHIGHPIAGDVEYGGRAEARLYLHAERLAFRHPTTGEWSEFYYDNRVFCVLSSQ